MVLVGSTSIGIMATRTDCRARIHASIVSATFLYIYDKLLIKFVELDLPEYESYEALRQQVYTAMTAGSEYFGFA